MALPQVRNATSLVYASPVALPLASCLHVSPVDLAREITEGLSNLEVFPPDRQDLNEELMKFIWKNLNINVLPSGWLRLAVNDRGVAHWLQFWLTHPPQLSPQLSIDHNLAAGLDASVLLPCQYAYARCNALLRLGDQEGLIELSGQPDWNWLAPGPVPWLAAETLRFKHSAEWQLLTQIVSVADQLFDVAAPSPAQNWLAIAVKLTQAWQAYDRACQIFSRPAEVELASSRLGLVMLTQRLLRWLLQARLGVNVPFEL